MTAKKKPGWHKSPAGKKIATVYRFEEVLKSRVQETAAEYLVSENDFVKDAVIEKLKRDGKWPPKKPEAE